MSASVVYEAGHRKWHDLNALLHFRFFNGSITIASYSFAYLPDIFPKILEEQFLEQELVKKPVPTYVFSYPYLNQDNTVP